MRRSVLRYVLRNAGVRRPGTMGELVALEHAHGKSGRTSERGKAP